MGHLARMQTLPTVHWRNLKNAVFVLIDTNPSRKLSSLKTLFLQTGGICKKGLYVLVCTENTLKKELFGIDNITDNHVISQPEFSSNAKPK